MKNSDYKYSWLKHQLIEKKQKGFRSTRLDLHPEMVDYIENVLGFKAIPYIFRITTKPLPKEIRNKDGLLKEIHFCKMDGKSRLFKRLSYTEQKLLKKYSIYYTPIKYKIVLN